MQSALPEQGSVELPRYDQLVNAFFATGAASTPAESARAWRAYCYHDDFPVYECWTQEYITGLAQYLIQRKSELQPASTLLHVLEAGAGSGKLTFGLRQALAQLEGARIEVDAVDNSARPMKRVAPGLVREADYQDALKEKDYAIVICSWMPFGEDWTAAFRLKESVQEYILIGHTGDGLNGDPLRTWGYRKLTDDDDDAEEAHSGDSDEDFVEGYLPEDDREYAREGFIRVDLPHLSKWQLCRFDNVDACSGQLGSSRTTSFRRQRNRIK